MKRFLLVMVVVLAGAVGLAFYMGWIGLASDSVGSFLNITFTVNKDKLQQDEKAALEKVQGIGHGAKDQTPAPAEKKSDLE
jgi:hypothetical protein